LVAVCALAPGERNRRANPTAIILRMAEQALLSLGQEFRFHFQAVGMVHLCSSRSGLDVAEVGGLAEGGKGVAGGDELVGDVSRGSWWRRCRALRRPIGLPGWRRVRGGRGRRRCGSGRSNRYFFWMGADQVTFHDLHVIYVEEELDGEAELTAWTTCHPRRSGRTCSRGWSTLLLRSSMQNVDAVVLGDFLDAVETGDGIFGALLVGHAFAIAGKSDDGGDAGLGGERNVFAENLPQSWRDFQTRLMALRISPPSTVTPCCRPGHTARALRLRRD